MNTTLQVPVKKQLRDKATRVAEKKGFSSLQEVVRVFLKQFADQEVHITLEMKPLQLSEKNDKKYTKIIDEVRSGKVQTKSFNDVDELFKELRK